MNDLTEVIAALSSAKTEQDLLDVLNSIDITS